jgi:hypothetical protein
MLSLTMSSPYRMNRMVVVIEERATTNTMLRINLCPSFNDIALF